MTFLSFNVDPKDGKSTWFPSPLGGSIAPSRHHAHKQATQEPKDRWLLNSLSQFDETSGTQMCSPGRIILSVFQALHINVFFLPGVLISEDTSRNGSADTVWGREGPDGELQSRWERRDVLQRGSCPGRTALLWRRRGQRRQVILEVPELGKLLWPWP